MASDVSLCACHKHVFVKHLLFSLVEILALSWLSISPLVLSFIIPASTLLAIKGLSRLCLMTIIILFGFLNSIDLIYWLVVELGDCVISREALKGSDIIEAESSHLKGNLLHLLDARWEVAEMTFAF
jgi:hypothetical protein